MLSNLSSYLQLMAAIYLVWSFSEVEFSQKVFKLFEKREKDFDEEISNCKIRYAKNEESLSRILKIESKYIQSIKFKSFRAISLLTAIYCIVMLCVEVFISHYDSFVIVYTMLIGIVVIMYQTFDNMKSNVIKVRLMGAILFNVISILIAFFIYKDISFDYQRIVSGLVIIVTIMPILIYMIKCVKNNSNVDNLREELNSL
jgi:hypothetical protein